MRVALCRKKVSNPWSKAKQKQLVTLTDRFHVHDTSF